MRSGSLYETEKEKERLETENEKKMEIPMIKHAGMVCPKTGKTRGNE